MKTHGGAVPLEGSCPSHVNWGIRETPGKTSDKTSEEGRDGDVNRGQGEKSGRAHKAVVLAITAL